MRMKKLILLLGLFLLNHCQHFSSREDREIKGFWQYVGEKHENEANLVQFRDSTVSYYLENVGIYTYKFYRRNDSIFFILNENEGDRTDRTDRAVQIKFFGDEKLLIEGEEIDTLKKISEELGRSLTRKIISNSKEYELITPE